MIILFQKRTSVRGRVSPLLPPTQSLNYHNTPSIMTRRHIHHQHPPNSINILTHKPTLLPHKPLRTPKFPPQHIHQITTILLPRANKTLNLLPRYLLAIPLASKHIRYNLFPHRPQPHFGELVFLGYDVVADACEGEQQRYDDAGPVAAEFAVQQDWVAGVALEVEEDCAQGSAGVVQDLAVAVRCALV